MRGWCGRGGVGEEGCLDGGVCRTLTNGVSVRGSVLFTMGVCGDEWLVVKKKKPPPRKKGNPRQGRKREARTMTVFLVGVRRRKG